MSFRRFMSMRVGLVALAAGLVTFGISGGCPQPQQPSSTDNQEELSPDSLPDPQPPADGGRPVPPPPIDDTNDQSAGERPGGGVDGGDSGGGGGVTNPVNQPIAVSISAPSDADINVLPGEDASIDYEVTGGNPSDGVINVALFYDNDGQRSTGDEVEIETGLPLQGNEKFGTSEIPVGRHYLGIRASNSREEMVAYAAARLVVVGEAVINVVQPTTDLQIRPGGEIPVQFAIDSLARSVTYEVFFDVDLADDGDEIPADFDGGGLSASKTVFARNGDTPFDAGVYYLGVRIEDSVGQSKVVYLQAGDAPLKIVVNLAPEIQVTTPTALVQASTGDPVDVELRAEDPEASATVEVFRDADGVFNGNEFVFETYELNQTTADYTATLDTTGLPPGTYSIGAAVSDGVGDPVADYAPGRVRINSGPGVTILQPADDLTVQAGTPVEVRWDATDLENRLEQVLLLVALDTDEDFLPDGDWDQVAIFENDQTATSVFDLATDGLLGRHVVAVRVIDDAGAEAMAIAPGAITVINDHPTITLRPSELGEPVEAPKFRDTAPTNPATLKFDIGDRENALKPQDENGIEIIIARDADLDGAPDDQDGDGEITDADLIYTDAPFGLHRGQNNYAFDADDIIAAGLLDMYPDPDTQEPTTGYFALGIRATDQAENQVVAWYPGTMVIDTMQPTVTVVSPAHQDQPIAVDRIGTLDVELDIVDTSPTKITLILDRDLDPLNDYEAWQEIEVEAELAAGGGSFLSQFDLTNPDIKTGIYYLYVLVTDDVVDDPVEFLAPEGSVSGEHTRIQIRDRLIGNVEVSTYDDSESGFVLRGFNVNDLAGASMSRVPDVDGDGRDEFMVVSRYGRAYLVPLDDPSGTNETYGFGEAYMIYSRGDRYRGVKSLNAVGSSSLPGLIFPGVRPPLLGPSSGWIGTDGVADATAVRDMDGDGLPELVFAFPRTESISLKIDDTTVQAPWLGPDLQGMGKLEYNAFVGMPPAWMPNKAQFVRGGLVFASSHNRVITNPNYLNRKNDRAFDLHESGQLFDSMQPPTVEIYVSNTTPIGTDDLDPSGGALDCDDPPDGEAETEFGGSIIEWDVVLSNQFPVGFHMPWTDPPADPPLANPLDWPMDYALPLMGYPDVPTADCTMPCNIINIWRDFTMMGMAPFPCTTDTTFMNSWNTNMDIDANGQPDVIWTGFYGSGESVDVQIRESAIGARLLGQNADDRFGSAVASDNDWLYVSAPDYTPLVADVPGLSATSAGGDRPDAGAVYMVRINRGADIGPNKAQLWMERTGQTEDGSVAIRWPVTDGELGRVDVTMPVPHQYIIESLGSIRTHADGQISTRSTSSLNEGCHPGHSGRGGPDANLCRTSESPFPPDSVAEMLYREPYQIVGPHVGSHIRWVRAAGDPNGDNRSDVLLGSVDIREQFNSKVIPGPGTPQDPTGRTVGGVFLAYGRAPVLQGDLLLERIAYSRSDPQRFTGVFIRGEGTAVIGRAFDGAGDFNGDGVDDVIIGSQHSNSDDGMAVVVLGDNPLNAPESPQGGWSINEDMNGHAIRFIGAAGSGSLAGAMVTSAGNVDGDYVDQNNNNRRDPGEPGYDDILIAAPNAVHPDDPTKTPGVVYLIYGSAMFAPEGLDTDGDDIIDDWTNNEFNLADVGTAALPGAVFIGREHADQLGGGMLQVANVDPAGNTIDVHSRGLAPIGDIDGDGYEDFAISAMKAAPQDRTRAGELYIIYGRGD